MHCQRAESAHAQTHAPHMAPPRPLGFPSNLHLQDDGSVLKPAFKHTGTAKRHESSYAPALLTIFSGGGGETHVFAPPYRFSLHSPIAVTVGNAPILILTQNVDEVKISC